MTRSRRLLCPPSTADGSDDGRVSAVLARLDKRLASSLILSAGATIGREIIVVDVFASSQLTRVF
jgi:hypothetical protein